MYKIWKSGSRELTSNKSKVGMKRKLLSTSIMLLISAILLTTTTFAWLVLSTSPEVTGITTQVGSNGSLEIALLNSETHSDMSKISNAVGSSRAATNSSVVSNVTWGNMIDVSSTSYGLDQIKLYPARLNVSSSNKVNLLAPLMSPTYGADGRVASVTANTVTGVYDTSNKYFSSDSENQGYGVRAIGTSTTLNAQQSAMTTASSSISNYSTSIMSDMKTSMTNDLGIIAGFISDSTETASTEQYEAIKDLSSNTVKSLENIDSALRMTVIAKLATVSSLSEDEFTISRQTIENATYTYDVIEDFEEFGVSLSGGFNGYCEEIKDAIIDAKKNDSTITGLEESKSGTGLKQCITKIMNPSTFTVNGIALSDVSNHQSELLSAVTGGTGMVLNVPYGQGYVPMIADYVGSFSCETILKGSSIPAVQTTVNIEASSDTSRLSVLKKSISSMEAVSSTSGTLQINDSYGYALDLAFRTNVQSSDLLLQTKGMQRVYSDSTSSATLGSGSTMKFYASDMDYYQTLDLINAIRIGFIDYSGNLKAIAKADIANATIDADGFNVVDLYLFDYTVDSDGRIVIEDNDEPLMGENATIMPLTQNVATSLTVVVWLDGDIVDNTMVSAVSENSLEGYLNLQFASNSELIPANNSQINNISMDKNDLLDNVSSSGIKAKYNLAAKNNQYTKESYEKFKSAYATASTVSEDSDATAAEIADANIDLINAEKNLKNNDLDQLRADIAAAKTNYGLQVEKVTYNLYTNSEKTKYYFKSSKSGGWFEANDSYTIGSYVQLKNEITNALSEYKTKDDEYLTIKVGEITYTLYTNSGKSAFYFKSSNDEWFEANVPYSLGNYVQLKDEIVQSLTECKSSDKNATITGYEIKKLSLNTESTQKYLINYSSDTRSNYESALCAAQKYIDNYAYESESALEYNIDSLENAREEMEDTAPISYQPYTYNNSTYYLGTDNNWYILNTSTYNKVTSQKTIRTLFDYAQKISFTEYKQLLHKTSDSDITNLTYYYLGNDGNWYTRVDTVVGINDRYDSSIDYNDFEFSTAKEDYFVGPTISIEVKEGSTITKIADKQSTISIAYKELFNWKLGVYETATAEEDVSYDHLGLDCYVGNPSGTVKIYDYATIVSTSYVRVSSQVTVNELKSAKGTLTIPTNNITILDTDTTGQEFTYNFQSTIESIKTTKSKEGDVYYSVEWDVNNSIFTTEVSDDGKTYTVKPIKGKHGSGTVSVEIETYNGNKYTTTANLTVVSLTKYELNETNYYYGTNKNWYTDEDLNTKVTNKTTLESLNNLLK